MNKCGYMEYMSGQLVLLEKRILQRAVGNGRSKVRSSGRAPDNESFVKRSTNSVAVFDRPLDCGVTIVEPSGEMMLGGKSVVDVYDGQTKLDAEDSQVKVLVSRSPATQPPP